MKRSLTYGLSCIGLIGVLLAQVLSLYHSPSHYLWPSILIVASLTPVHGIINNLRYTFQWSGFLALFFMCVGITEFFIFSEQQSSSIMLFSSVAFYFGVVFHAKKLAVMEALQN